jgi:hypothetical protein
MVLLAIVGFIGVLAANALILAAAVAIVKFVWSSF